MRRNLLDQRVLLVTRNFPPMWGGMERLNWHLAVELSKHAEVRVLAPKGARQHAPAGVTVDEVPLTPLPRFLVGALLRAAGIARRWRPTVVLAGSGLMAPVVQGAARAAGAQAFAYVHGLDITAPSRIYRALWWPALRSMDGVIANSRATAELAVSAGVPRERVNIVHPGVELPKLDPAARGRFRAEHGLGDRPILLSVGRLTPRKGLREFVTEVLPRIVRQRPDTLLLVIGAAPQQALLKKTQTPDSIRAAAKAAGVAGNLQFLGVITDRSRLSDAYQAADVHVFPVRELPNDPEGFGMVALEAAAHGLATVAYAVGGVADAVADGVSGYLVPPGEKAVLAAAVLRLLDRSVPAADLRAYAASYAWPVFGSRLAAHLTAAAGTSR